MQPVGLDGLYSYPLCKSCSSYAESCRIIAGHCIGRSCRPEGEKLLSTRDLYLVIDFLGKRVGEFKLYRMIGREALIHIPYENGEEY